MNRVIFLIFLVLTCANSFGQTFTISGKVKKIDVHSNSWGTYNPNDIGVLSLYIEGLPKSCNTSNGGERIAITSDHPLFESVISIALSAKLSDKNLTVTYLNSCNIRTGSWDFGLISFDG